MRRFAELFDQLDRTTKTNRKVELLEQFFGEVPTSDAAWALFFLSGEKLSRLVTGKELREWGAEAAGLPLWLVEESYDVVGDLAETVTLLVDRTEPQHGEEQSLSELVLECKEVLSNSEASARRKFLITKWRSLGRTERFLLNKILTGGFRIGVSKKLVVKSLASLLKKPEALIAHRLTGTVKPTAEFFEKLDREESTENEVGQPYPFFLAHSLEKNLPELGAPREWYAEWKWDGIRAQLVKRSSEVLLWSRGEEGINESFPEIVQSAIHLPDGTVLDGELVGWQQGAPLPFTEFQRRLNRRRVGKKILQEVPACFLLYDVLEESGRDIRSLAFVERRASLEQLFTSYLESKEHFALSPEVEFSDWSELEHYRQEARERLVEGLMLKRRSSEYRVGRKRGDWWKWKVDPLTLDMVLTYAQKGHGRRANMFSDYTFGLWKEGELVTVAKAYSGLTDQEISQVDRFVRQNTVQRFGPVRAVRPELVFEIAFDAIQESSRHKSGLALRFPRIKRMRNDKVAKEADTVEHAIRLLAELQR